MNLPLNTKDLDTALPSVLRWVSNKLSGYLSLKMKTPNSIMMNDAHILMQR